jgi:RNA polymerase sigma factor (sigma-70 family)
MTIAEYNKIVDLHADSVFRFIWKNMKDRDRAQDVVQEAFEKMWLKVNEINFEKAKSYLFTTAYRTMIDLIRREKKMENVGDWNGNELSWQQLTAGVKEAVELALSRLPEIQRTVILLRDYEGYDYREIGEITGLNESQVKVYIFRGRLAMKNFIGSTDLVV